MDKKKVLIIGYGEIGQAINKLLNKTKVDVFIYDKYKKIHNKLNDEKYDVIFLAVPSWNLVSAIKEVKKNVDKNSIFVTISKGIELKNKKLPYELLEKIFPNNKKAHIAGPMLAEDIMKGNISGAVIGVDSKKVFNEVASLLISEKFIIQYSKDIKSVALSGVLKNIYSLFFGILSAGKVGDNSFGVYLPQIIYEMQIIMKSQKADFNLIISMAVIGDFVATAFSPYSNNRKRGKQLVSKTEKKVDCESINSLKVIYNLTKQDRKKLPILNSLYNIVYKKGNWKKEIDKIYKFI